MSTRKMSSREARANFADLLGSVHYTKEPVIIEKNGKPYAVVVSPEDYEILRKEKKRASAVADQVGERSTDKEPEDVLKDVMAEVKAIRAQMLEDLKK